MDRQTSSNDFEKRDGDVQHVDGTVSSDTTPDDHGFTPDEQRRIVRRIDRRLVVTLGVVSHSQST